MDNHAQTFSQCIRNCASALSHHSGEAGATRTDCRFMPQYPLVNVFWGDFEGRKTVEGVFSDFWPSGPLVGTLVEFMDGCSEEEACRLELRARAIQLMANNQITDFSTLRVAHYVSLFSPQLDQQLNMIYALHTKKLEGINTTTYPLIFLFNDCKIDTDAPEGFKRLRHSHQILKDIPRCQEFALSPQLRDNSYLRRGNADLNENQVEENYRIAADVAFLSSTAPNTKGTPHGLSAWLEHGSETLQIDGCESIDVIATASYLLMQKPTRRIAAVTLNTICVERSHLAAEKEKELVKLHVHDNATQFLSQLKLTDGIETLNKAFDTYICPTLPDASCLDPIIHWSRAKKESSFEAANAQTGGALQLFAQRYFADFSLEGIDTKALADAFSFEVLAKTDYLFAENYFKNCSAFLRDVRPQIAGGIYDSLINLARCEFYKQMMPKLEDAMSRRAADAQAFRVFLQNLTANLRLPPATKEAGLEDVDSYYENKAKNLLDPDALIAALQPRSEPKEIYAALEKAFSTLIEKDPAAYRTSLEAEVKQRTIPNPDGVAPNVIASFFGADLSNKQRLPVMQVDTQNTQGFYLIHTDTNLGTYPEQHIQKVHTDILDRAERLQLYHVDISSLLEGRSNP